jgi:hypothetical protein
VIEAFVGSQKFTEGKIQRPRQNHSPSFLTSCAEGVILKDRNNFARGLYRALLRSEHRMAKQLIGDAEHFYRTGEKDRVVEIVGSILEMVGGKLYDGYSKVG